MNCFIDKMKDEVDLLSKSPPIDLLEEELLSKSPPIDLLEEELLSNSPPIDLLYNSENDDNDDTRLPTHPMAEPTEKNKDEEGMGDDIRSMVEPTEKNKDEEGMDDTSIELYQGMDMDKQLVEQVEDSDYYFGRFSEEKKNEIVDKCEEYDECLIHLDKVNKHITEYEKKICLLLKKVKKFKYYMRTKKKEINKRKRDKRIEYSFACGQEY